MSSQLVSNQKALAPSVPYWRLSSLYFFYFLAVGILLPYWGLYLDYLGLTPAQIGVVVAIPMLTKVLAPNIWGWLADASGQYLLVIRTGAVFALVFFIGLLIYRDYWAVVLYAAAFSFFWNAILPQFEVLTLDALGSQTDYYSRIRLWGSIGFIVSVVFLGLIFERVGLAYLPIFFWLLLLMLTACTFALPKVDVHHEKASSGQFLTSLWRTPVVCFLIASVFLNLSHGVFYGFYSLHLASFDYTKTSIGLLWAVGVIAEILIFLKVPRIFSGFNLWQCYLFGLAASALRWVLVALLPEHGSVMIFAQLLHALTFGLTHAVAIEIVRRSFAKRDRGKAQAMYSAVSFGAGGALGAYLSGVIWSFGAIYSFLFAALMSCIGVAIVFFGMRAFRKSLTTM